MTKPTLCPCCGTEMITKLACPIGCPGPESGTKWKRSRKPHCTVEDAKQLPEVMALVEWALGWHELDARNGSTKGSRLSGILAPFITAPNKPKASK